MAIKGCYVCGTRLDKFYILATPNGKKFKLCGKCMTMAKYIAKSSETEEEAENVEKEQ